MINRVLLTLDIFRISMVLAYGTTTVLIITSLLMKQGNEMDNYSIYHVDNYGHGKQASNDLADDQKVTIADHDGFFDVYECDSDELAQNIADWYISAVYEHYPATVEIIKIDNRYFTIETD